VPLNHAMAANYEGRLFVMGGWVAEGSEVDARESNRVYELKDEKWVERAPLNSPRVAGAAAAVGDKLVVTGGQAGGKLLLIAPPPSDAGAEAARAGLENLARTLSVEWARYGIRTAALLPGAATEPEKVAELVAFLASKAGDYYSGCRFDLGSV